MISLKRPLFGILWFCIFFAAIFSVASIVLSVHEQLAGHDPRTTVAALLSNILETKINLLSLPLYIGVLIAAAKGWLPGTRPESADAPAAAFGFSDALAIVVYLVLIQTGLGFVQGSICELIGQPRIAQLPVAHCTLAALSAILLALFALKKSGTPLRDAVGSSHIHVLAVVACLALVAGTALVESEIDNIQKTLFSYPDMLQQVMSGMLSEGALSVFLLVVLAPVTEEIVFRGIILKSLLKRYSVTRAVILSSIAFSLAHMDPMQVIPALGSGVLLGWLYYETKNLWLCILLHSCHNLLTFLLYNNYVPLHIPGFSEMSTAPLTFQPVWLDGLGVLLLWLGIMTVRALVKREWPESDVAA